MPPKHMKKAKCQRCNRMRKIYIVNKQLCASCYQYMRYLQNPERVHKNSKKWRDKNGKYFRDYYKNNSEYWKDYYVNVVKKKRDEEKKKLDKENSDNYDYLSRKSINKKWKLCPMCKGRIYLHRANTHICINKENENV